MSAGFRRHCHHFTPLSPTYNPQHGRRPHCTPSVGAQRHCAGVELHLDCTRGLHGRNSVCVGAIPGSTSRSSDAGGSGVGLTISRAIALSHGGTVNATSPGLNGEAPSGSPVRSPTTTHEPYLSRSCQQPRDFLMLLGDSDQTSHAGSVGFRRVSLAPRTLRLPREEGPGSGLPGFTRSSTLEPSSNPSSTTRGLRFDTRADVIV